MKTSTSGISTAINKDEMKELLKESTDTDIQKKMEYKKSFGLVDLWHVQKKHKSLGSSIRW